MLVSVLAQDGKNYLFVGHEEAGENLAGLLSLLMTCEACGVNPQAWLADILLRVQTPPQTQLDDLLPARGKDLFAPPSPSLSTTASPQKS